MLALGVLIIFIVGLGIITGLDREKKLGVIESIGLMFPVGLFIQVLVLTLLDYLAIKISVTSVLSVNALIIGAIAYYIKKKNISTDLNFNWQKIKNKLLARNFVWLILFALLVYIEYMNFVKCIYFPTFDRDSLAAFDTLGYIFAKEGTISGASIFDVSYNLNIKAPGSYIAYPPFTQVAYAYVYLFGAATSKLVPAILFASLLLNIYSLLVREVKATGAMLITLFIALTPEMISFSSMSGSNVIHAIYASLGLIYGLKWVNSNTKNRDMNFWCSAILLSANFLVRTEGIVFIGAVGLFALIATIKQKNYLNLLIWGAICITPSLCWKIHQSVTGLTSESFIITELFYDKEKMNNIIMAFKGLLSQQAYYGWTFYALLLSCVISVFFIKNDKKMPMGWAMFALSLIAYGIVIYQVDYLWDTIFNVLNFSAKRFFFCFAIIAWYISATNYPIRKVFIYIDEQLSFKQ